MSSLREINIKYHGHYYPDGIINFKDLNLGMKLVYERPYQNDFIYCVAYKISNCEKPMHISFDAVDECIVKLGRIKYLSLFYPNEKYERMFDRIKYLLIQSKK